MSTTPPTLGDAISKVLNGMQPGKSLPLFMFIRQVEIVRNAPDDGAVVARLYHLAKQAEPGFEIKFEGDKGRHVVKS